MAKGKVKVYPERLIVECECRAAALIGISIGEGKYRASHPWSGGCPASDRELEFTHPGYEAETIYDVDD